MTPAELDLRQYAMQGLVAEVAVMALDYFHRKESLGVSMKGAQDWLTVADGAVEAVLREKIGVLFPRDAVVGEEGGGAASDVTWIIDPIDGTANFARGERNWCISVGLVVKGVPEIGIISAPSLEEVYVGRRGRGVTLNGAPIGVSGGGDVRRAYFEMGWSTRVPLDAYLAMVRKAFEAGASVKRSASGALGLCHVATGRTDGYAELHINAWDVAAGMVIAGEAGAVMNDFFAGSGMTKGNPILCCTPGLAAELEAITGIVSRR